MIIFKYILEVVKGILNIKFMQIENFEILLDNRYISFNINAAKDGFKSNEPLLSLRYNLFSSDFTNEEKVQNQKEGLSTINFFNGNLNIRENFDEITFKAYFLEETNNIKNDNLQDNKLKKAIQKKETIKLRKKRKLNGRPATTKLETNKSGYKIEKRGMTSKFAKNDNKLTNEKIFAKNGSIAICAEIEIANDSATNFGNIFLKNFASHG